MKKIVALLVVLPAILTAGQKDWIPRYLESNNRLKQNYNEPMVIIQTNDRKQVRVPTSLVQGMETLNRMQQDVGAQGEIPLQQISSTQLLPVLALMESAQDHPQLKGKKLYDAMSKDVHIADGIEVLKAVNYLDIKPPIDKPIIEFLAHELALAQDSPVWKPRRNIPLSEQLRDFGSDAAKNYGALIARNYFLRTGKNLPNLSQDMLNHENYAFSVKEYLDHKATHNFLREKLGIYFSVGFDRFMPIGGPDVYSSRDGIPITNSVDLSKLNINDIEGLNQYRSYIHPAAQWRLKAIWLNHNKIKSLTKPNSFSAFRGGVPAYDEGVVALVFSNNNITEVDPVVFNNLPNLKIVDLRNNPLTQEQQQRLRAAHPQIQFRF